MREFPLGPVLLQARKRFLRPVPLNLLDFPGPGVRLLGCDPMSDSVPGGLARLELPDGRVARAGTPRSNRIANSSVRCLISSLGPGDLTSPGPDGSDGVCVESSRARAKGWRLQAKLTRPGDKPGIKRVTVATLGAPRTESSI